MARRITLVALIGLVVASCWVVLSLFTHIGSYTTILEVTAPAALLRRMPMKYYEFMWLNAAIYAAIALVIELTLRLLVRRPAH